MFGAFEVECLKFRGESSCRICDSPDNEAIQLSTDLPDNETNTVIRIRNAHLSYISLQQDVLVKSFHVKKWSQMKFESSSHYISSTCKKCAVYLYGTMSNNLEVAWLISDQ